MILQIGVFSSLKNVVDVFSPFPDTQAFIDIDTRLTDAELLQYCLDPAFPERERLILTKRNTTPGGAELRRAQGIAKEQQLAAQEKAISERKENNNSSLGRTKTNKLEALLGERPTSFQRPPQPGPGGSPPTGAIPRDQTRPNTKRLRNFFGQRPPSELISSNLAEYFPDHEKNMLEETVRNSIRRSTRMSHAGRRFSTATTASSASSRDKDIPPLPTMSDTRKDSVSISSGAATPPRLRAQARPISMRRAVTSASYANSIVESLAEDDDEAEDSNVWSVVDALRASESNDGTLRLLESSESTLRLSESNGDTLRLTDANDGTLRPTESTSIDADLDKAE